MLPPRSELFLFGPLAMLARGDGGRGTTSSLLAGGGRRVTLTTVVVAGWERGGGRAMAIGRRWSL